MKTKILITLLLVVLTIGAVSAADDNMTSTDLTASENFQIEEPETFNPQNCTQADVLLESYPNGDVLELKKPDMEVSIDDEAYIDKTTVTVILPGDALGRVSLRIDDDSNIVTSGDYSTTMEFSVSFKTPGTHTIHVEYAGNSKYSKCTKTVSCDVDYRFNIWYFTNQIDIEAPLDINMSKLEIRIDNMTLRNYLDYYDTSYYTTILLNTSYLKAGKHNIQVNYNGDKNFHPLTTSEDFTLKSEIEDPNGWNLDFGKDYSYTIRLPEDANGDVVLYIDNEEHNRTTVINGSGKIGLNSVNPKRHLLKIQYEGDKYNLSYENEIVINAKIDIISDYCFGGNTTLVVYFTDDTDGSILINNQTVPIINGKATFTAANTEFDYNTYDICWNDVDKTPIDSINVDIKPYMTHFVIGNGSYISINLGKNTTGNARLILHERESDDWYDYYHYYHTLAQSSYENGSAILYLPELMGGYYEFSLEIEDDFYGNYSREFYIHNMPKITVPNIIKNIGELDFELSQAEGTLMVFIDDKEYATEHVKNGKSTIMISGLSYGKHKISASFKGTDECSKKFSVPDNYATFPYYINYYKSYRYTQEIFYEGPVSIVAEDVVLGNSAVINIKAEDSVKDLVVSIMDKDYAINSTETNITLSDLKSGTYNVKVSYTDNNTQYTFNKTFTVGQTVGGKFIELNELIEQTEECETLQLDKDYANTGFENEIDISKSITIDGNGHTIDASNTSRIFNIFSYYAHGSIEVIVKNIIFKNGNANKGGAIHAECEDYTISHINWQAINCTFIQCSAKEGGAIYGYGECLVVNSTFIQCNAKEGGAIWSEDGGWSIINSTFTKCSANHGGAIYFEYKGNKILNCQFINNTADKYPDCYSKYPLTTTVTAPDASVVYSSGQYYTIKVYGNDGHYAKDVKVIVKMNGKAFKTITAANGVAKFKVTQTPGTYKLSITALNYTAKSTLTVKHIVTLKNAKVKKSAQKLMLQASLGKVNGKYIKGKQVTFKFNGKTYKTKTDSKGIAKVTIPKSVLSKLKVGKKITYQATYLKDTVKKTVKIQK